jgi:prevent-host-death family protein
MDEVISAAEANRKFSALLRGVREGRSYVVTSHGQPVARLVPATGDEATAERARERLFARLESQTPVNAGRWTRDELYDD